MSDIPTDAFGDGDAPTVGVGPTEERPTDVFASPHLPERPAPAPMWSAPGADPAGPPALPTAPAIPGAPSTPPIPAASSPWAPPAEPGPPAPEPSPVASEWQRRSMAWPPSPPGPPAPPGRPPAGGGFPPPLPSAPAAAGLVPGPTFDEPVASGDPTPRPLTSFKVAVLVGLVSAVVAATVTALIFVAAGVGTKDRATSATTIVNGPSNRLAGNALDIQALLAKARPSVVAIHVKATTSRGSIGGAGTGVIISDDGLVLTNAHVVASADLNQMRVTLADGSEKPAELVGSLADNDIALLRIKDATDLTQAELGSSADARVGDDVVAIGNALNLGGEPTVTEGIISAKERVIDDDAGNRHGHLIQTDAAINPGNSGGPLLNAQGQVIGINTAVIGSNGDQSVQNIGFAIAIDEVIPLIDQIKSGKGTVTPDQAFLGVQSKSVSEITDDEKDGFEISATEGAVVEGVTSNSSAADAGLRQGDVITAIDGRPVTSKEDVGNVIRSKKPGDTITIEYERRGNARQAETTLKARKDSGGG